MFINKQFPLVHLIRFRNGTPLMYMTTIMDQERAYESVNHFLRRGIFQNLAFQAAYDKAKLHMGLLDPDPNDLLVHQFIEIANTSGYNAGHWLIRDYLARNIGLSNIVNIGDWLDDEGFIDITPPDQDKRKYLRVTDIGKYYAANGCFDTNVFPLYILASEDSQIQSTGLLENHRDPQPKHVGYDTVMGEGTVALAYDGLALMDDVDLEVVKEKPIIANGRLYSSIDQFAKARNLPAWFILEQINNAEDMRYDFAADWHFV